MRPSRDLLWFKNEEATESELSLSLDMSVINNTAEFNCEIDGRFLINSF